MAIKVIVYENGKPSKGHKVELGWGSDKPLTDGQGEAIFSDVPTRNHTVYVDGHKVIDDKYESSGVYRVFLGDDGRKPLEAPCKNMGLLAFCVYIREICN